MKGVFFVVLFVLLIYVSFMTVKSFEAKCNQNNKIIRTI